ncbi:glycosyltransferase [Clostridium perfringens]
MNILFIGSCLPRSFEGKIKHLSAAGNQYQNNLIKSLKKIHNVKVLSYINIDIKNSINEIKKECKEEDIDLIFLKNSKIRALSKFRKKMKKEIKWADKIIVYNILYPWIGMPTITKRYKKKSILIGADFIPKEECNGIMRKFYSSLICKEFCKYDKFVMLSSGFNKYLKENQEKEIINGCVEWENFKNIKRPTLDNIITISYTGLISKNTGVNLLVESFLNINIKNIRLVISGQDGDLTEYIKSKVEKDNRIIYKGFVSKEEYYNILEESHILVNPRDMSYIQNSTNFPSKVLEYIASGRLIISTKFRGYLDYEKYIKFIDSNSNDMEKMIVKCIEEIKKKPDINYEKNRKFIQEYTWEKQINRYL